MAKFSVGEIAIGVNCSQPHHDGMECEITDGFGLYDVVGEIEQQRGYLTLFNGEAEGGFLYEHQLRKRRPPQDWVKLCKLNDIPEEVTV